LVGHGGDNDPLDVVELGELKNYGSIHEVRVLGAIGNKQYNQK
jgi:hypothetical protein